MFSSLSRLPQVSLLAVHQAILFIIGLQHEDLSHVKNGLDVPSSQPLAIFIKFVEKAV